MGLKMYKDASDLDINAENADADAESGDKNSNNKSLRLFIQD
eukprot:CAMPEP_0116990238 /NCGR_PEP_ID=MMETSP0467-20121206/65347_1 /TAXON_ID=283647 /ORGANISM="Mesodinium pulex, Strain SPMC105" /LENGTH=41 /DNA_ID= /DNA_START= /DNA_END= /DNA_ORIENTATION=